jgi:hypothetical protein
MLAAVKQTSRDGRDRFRTTPAYACGCCNNRPAWMMSTFIRGHLFDRPGSPRRADQWRCVTCSTTHFREGAGALIDVLVVQRTNVSWCRKNPIHCGFAGDKASPRRVNDHVL